MSENELIISGLHKAACLGPAFILRTVLGIPEFWLESLKPSF